MFRTVMAAALAVSSAGELAVQGVDPGEADYATYCSGCHGVDGRGQGQLTSLMPTTVPDLTQLTRNNDGVFPMLEVIRYIDGRSEDCGHGAAIPACIGFFDIGNYVGPDQVTASTANLDLLITRGRILSLTYFLESIQSQ